MKRVLTTVLGVLAFTIGAGVPLSAANREHQQLMADIRMLQEQNQQLQLLLAALQDTLRVVNGKLEEQATTGRKLAADQKLQVDTVSGDVRVVREKLDDTNVRLASIAQELDALRQSIPKIVPVPAPYDPTAPVDPAAEGAAAPPAGPVAPSTAGLSPQRMFDEAKSDYAVGSWQLALYGFEQLIKTFPKSPLAPEAQYYIGETYSLDNKNDKALEAYEALIANYPGSNQVPGAYYKRGVALSRLGQTAKALESFQYCVQNFPTSEAGRLAKQQLDRLQKP